MITRRSRLNAGRAKNDRLRDRPKATPLPLVGYMRVSKADGSQTLDLQQDALDAAGVPERNIYSDPPAASVTIGQDWSRASRPYDLETLWLFGSSTDSAVTCATW